MRILHFEDYLLTVLMRAIFTWLYNIHHHVLISNDFFFNSFIPEITSSVALTQLKPHHVYSKLERRRFNVEYRWSVCREKNIMQN